MTKTTFGETIQKIRKSPGITQNELHLTYSAARHSLKSKILLKSLRMKMLLD